MHPAVQVRRLAIAAAGALLLQPLGAAAASRVIAADAPDLSATLLALPIHAGVRLTGVRFAGEEETQTLDLEKVPVFADGATVRIDGATASSPVTQSAYFSGVIDADTGSSVFLVSSRDNNLSGVVTDGAGHRHQITGDRDHPVSARPADPATPTPAFECGSLPTPQTRGRTADELAHPPPALQRRTTYSYTVKVAVETDNEFFRLFNDQQKAIDYIGALLGYISTLYDRDLGTRLEVGEISLWNSANDPWQGSNTSDAMAEFKSYWKANREGVERSTTLFLSGRPIAGGLAQIGSLCEKDWSYAFAGNIGGRFDPGNTSLLWDAVVTAHELGHNFDSPHTHCYAGLGGNASQIDRCGSESSPVFQCNSGTTSLPGPNALNGSGKGTLMSYCHLFDGGFANIALNFGLNHPDGIAPSREAERMRSYVESRAAADPACIRIEGAQLYALQVSTSGPGRVVSDPAGIDCGSNCEHLYFSGDAVTLTAEANLGFNFTGWGGACSGTAPCTVSMSQARQVSATFSDAQPLTVTVKQPGQGRIVSTPAGIDCGDNCLALFPLGTAVNLEAVPAPGYIFDGWVGACFGYAGCPVTMSGNREVTANFKAAPNVRLTLRNAGNGRITGTLGETRLECHSTCDFDLPQNSTLTLEQRAAYGSRFLEWGGACSGRGLCNVVLDGAKEVAANFDDGSYDLLTVVDGSGKVTSDRSGIACPPDCSESFQGIGSIALEATAAPNAHFGGWNGACLGKGECLLTMDENKRAVALFAAPNRVALNVGLTGPGTVTSQPAGIDCGTTCGVTLAPGSNITLTAVPAAGYSFVGWSGACNGNGSCTLTLNGDAQVAAVIMGPNGCSGTTLTLPQLTTDNRESFWCRTAGRIDTSQPVTVEPGGNVGLFSGQIRLAPGFHARRGGKLLVHRP